MNRPAATMRVWLRAVAYLLVMLVKAGGIALAADDNVICDRFPVEPDEAIAACTRLLTADHDAVNQPAIYLNRGGAWLLKGAFSYAIDDFTAAVQRDPKFIKAYQNRGLAWHRSGDFDRAIADFNLAIGSMTNPPRFTMRGARRCATRRV
jgi:tetratricopeptide (TPR) repeat protein